MFQYRYSRSQAGRRRWWLGQRNLGCASGSLPLAAGAFFSGADVPAYLLVAFCCLTMCFQVEPLQRSGLALLHLHGLHHHAAQLSLMLKKKKISSSINKSYCQCCRTKKQITSSNATRVLLCNMKLVSYDRLF
jgi:hypothetical protein